MPRRTTRSMAAAGTNADDSSSASSRSSPAPRKGQPTKKDLQAKSIDKQKILLSSDTGHFSLIRAFHLADLITLMNGFCGVMSIFASLRHCLIETASSNLSASTTAAPLVEAASDVTNLYIALVFLPFGLFFDFLDGRVARWRNKSSLMGQELDSLADLISFGAAPAVVAFALGMRSVADTIGLTVFVLCGLARLARFNVTVQSVPKDASGKSKYFEGTPIPTTLGLDAIMAWWVSKGWVGEGGVPGGVLFPGTPVQIHAAVLLFIVHGCLMTSRTIRIPKP